MNIPTITRTSSAQWLRRGIVAVGALLIASATTLGLVNRTSLYPAPAVMPVARMSSAPSAAQLRYEDFKLRQIEGREGTAVSASSAAQLRYEDFKLWQIYRMETPKLRRNRADTSADARYEDFKLRQIDRIGGADADRGVVAPSAAQLRFVNFKLCQIGRYV